MSIKRIIPLMIVFILALTSCGNEAKQEEKKNGKIKTGIAELSLTLNNKWKHVKNDNSEENLDEYQLQYMCGEANLMIKVYYIDEVDNIVNIEENICSEYNKPKDRVVDISNTQGIEYIFDNVKAVHVTTDYALYTITCTNEEKAPEKLSNIIKNITIDKENLQ